ncbi:MAG: HD domain-containing phosphohydrolase [Terracidiphilus sp.]|jgi:PAS domain S-box-containing protein
MSRTSRVFEPHSLYELSWIYAPGGMFAFDSATGKLIDVNPAAVALSGYSREELAGKHISLLHPEDERKRVKAEFLKSGQQPLRYRGFHMQRKDGRCAPVMISLSKSSVLDGRSVAISVYFNIAELEEREHRLKVQKWALSAYAGAALALASARTSHELLKAVCEAITSESVYSLAWVGIAEDGPGKPIRVAALAGKAVKEDAATYVDGSHLSWSEDEPGGKGPAGICIRTNKLQSMAEIEKSYAMAPWRERAMQAGIRSSVYIPLRIKGGWRGALVIYAAQPNAFEAPVIEVFQHLAEQIVHAVHALDQGLALNAEQIELATTRKQLTEALSAMVAPMVAAMEMRDPYTSGHESRSADIAVAIGREMGWPEERLEGLHVAAQIHDIGKISIPAEILTKPTRLTAGEWGLIHEHPDTGYIILKDIPFAWPVAEIVRQHHERLDGSGYPLGLKGDAILPEAKILAVADIVEAMASHRPYRPAIKMNIVLQQIEKQAGSQLDAEAVRACAALFRKKRLVLPGWSRQ